MEVDPNEDVAISGKDSPKSVPKPKPKPKTKASRKKGKKTAEVDAPSESASKKVTGRKRGRPRKKEKAEEVEPLSIYEPPDLVPYECNLSPSHNEYLEHAMFLKKPKIEEPEIPDVPLPLPTYEEPPRSYGGLEEIVESAKRTRRRKKTRKKKEKVKPETVLVYLD